MAYFDIDEMGDECPECDSPLDSNGYCKHCDVED